jgi:Flp pilus assembly protein TadD
MTMFRSFSRSSAQALLLYACLGLAALQFAGCSSKAQRAQNYYKSGTSYLAKNDFVKARLEFKNAVQLKPDMIEAWRGLVKIDEHDRNWKALAGDLSKIVELAPKHNAARMQLSKLFLLGGAFDRALKLANDASKLEPKNPEVLALKAAILFKLQDTKGAIQTAQKALEIDPGNAAANASLAVAKFSEGDASGALQALENVAPAHKDDVGILTLKINIFEHMGKTQQAETLLRRLTELHPKEPFFRTQLIRFYIAHKRPDDALHELRAVVEANPADTAAELELVVLLNACFAH